MIQNGFLKILLFSLVLGFAVSTSAQRKKPEKPVKKPAAVKSETPPEKPESSDKKNSRPDDVNVQSATPALGKRNVKAESTSVSNLANPTNAIPVYFYEFSRPGFVLEKVWIEHDENGIGTIRFMKMYYEEELTDPLALSSANSERVKTLWNNLNFLDSSENYQYEKDYSHLGNLKFTMKKDERERTAAFNWTTNPDAKALADEYRKITNQHIWIFDMNLSRENQPLESAKMIDSLDSQIKRNEIADPEQMLPYLKDLGNDERIPLLSRNHALRIVNDIEKQLAKKKPVEN